MPRPLYVDVHVLQTVPPSNLNRDDAGTPKQAIYGGVRRARVSSQAWKRATRTAFATQVGKEELGTRTRRIGTLLSQRLAARTNVSTDDALRIATAMLEPLKIKAGKREAETAYLLFFGRGQLERLVTLVADRAAELAALTDAELTRELAGLPVSKTLGNGHPIDVALFGRMVADIPGLNVDAATQVAHALSTHQVEVEFDYYTAVDDENLADETGAGMIGTIEFNSATLYRFATVGVHQLTENLDGDVEAAMRALRMFLQAFVTSMPTGHENSFAHHTAPHLVSVVLRDAQPVNLVSAFERPVRTSGEGYAHESARRLAGELLNAAATWGLQPLAVLSAYATEDAHALSAAFGEPRPFGEVVEAAVSLATTQVTLVPA